MATFGECWALYERERLAQCVDQRRQETGFKGALSLIKREMDDQVPEDEILIQHIRRPRYSSQESEEGLIVYRPHLVATNTIRRELTVLRAVLRYAERRRLLSRAPNCDVPPYDPKIKALSNDELRQIAMHCDACPALATYFRLAINTGARPGAILDLTWDRVDFDNESIDFNNRSLSKIGRRKRRAIVPMNPGLRVFLSSLTRAQHNFVVDNCGSPVTNIRYLWNKHGAGKWATPHDLRHSVATAIAKAHGLLKASKMLGHSSTRVTEQVYVHVGVDDLRDAARTMESKS